MARPAERLDPFTNFNFLVEIDGITRAAFHECSGLDSAIDVIEHREGGAPSPRKLPGMTKYANIVLKWGMTDDRRTVRLAPTGGQGRRPAPERLDRRCSTAGAGEGALELLRCLAAALGRGRRCNSEGTDVAIETLELALERLERAA